MSQQDDWDVLARYVAGESSPDEVAKLESRFASQPADKALLDALATITGRMAATVPADLDVEAALSSVKSRRGDPLGRSLTVPRQTIGDSRRIRWRVAIPAIAAAVVLAVGIAGYLKIYSGGTVDRAAMPFAHKVATGVGAIDSLRLPDGTRVILGPLSSVRIAADYGADRRDVIVKGDVYLEVVHDSSKPFTVHADGVTVRDIGTKFSVRSDSSLGVTVSVIEGSVSLQGANTGRASGIVLKPGERGVVLSDGQITKQRGAPEDLAWLRRQLVFREAPMGEVAASLHRWYGIVLSVPDASLAARHLTATFSGEPPERVLEVIRLALGADIERRGDTAIVKARR